MASKRKKKATQNLAPAKKPDAEALEIFEKFWKPLVCDSKGRLIRDAVITELVDFCVLMRNAALVYDHVTGGRISKPNTKAAIVIGEATEVENEALQDVLNDEREKWEAEHACQNEVCYVALGGKTTAFAGRHARVTTPEGTFIVAWCSDTDQLFTDDSKPLPHVWRDTARDAIKALLEKTNA